MRVLPVLDLRAGEAVHAVAGERGRYRPVRSRLCDSAQPLALARSFRSALGLETIYIADLDAIQGLSAPAAASYAELARDGFELIVDAGIGDAAALRALAVPGIDPIVALETLADAARLRDIVAAVGPRGFVFSVDLRGGRALGGPAAWRDLSPRAIATAAIECGARRLLLLDLAAVGVAGGCPVGDLARALRAAQPDLELLAGGGVRHRDDLLALRACGVDGALVATALHTGSIGREELSGFSDAEPAAIS